MEDIKRACWEVLAQFNTDPVDRRGVLIVLREELEKDLGHEKARLEGLAQQRSQLGELLLGAVEGSEEWLRLRGLRALNGHAFFLVKMSISQIHEVLEEVRQREARLMAPNAG